VTDPVDARLLAALAELGKTAVHELAAKVGMDPREVAFRLVALSGSGLPLLVGVESDPNGLRAAIAGPWPNRNPAGRQGALQGAPPHPVQGTPRRLQRPGDAVGPLHPPPAQAPLAQAPMVRPPPASARTAESAVRGAWGPPQSSSWARGDEKPPGQQSPGKRGRPGDVMETPGLQGERLAVQLWKSRIRRTSCSEPPVTASTKASEPSSCTPRSPTWVASRSCR
jgi:DNA-binding Lrp family transcriptional regulator